jgi:hypothetical protein
MVEYTLTHLTQDASQKVSGPIQDDEALLLFSVIRCMRIKTVVEVGGLSGYSALNFCEAVGRDGIVITLDLVDVPKVAPNHRVIVGDARNLRRADYGFEHIDLLFLDCHDYDVQMNLLNVLIDERLIDDDTVIALHDTNVHPYQSVNFAYRIPEGWVHQPVERRMVNDLHRAGYEAICFHTRSDQHDETMPYRHGVTLLKRFKTLGV